MAKWQDRVQRMHANSRLVGRGYKLPNPGETPDCAFMPGTAGTTPAFNQLSTAQIRDPFRR